MNVKLFEVRDSATFIPVFAFRCRPSSEEQRYLLARAGFGRGGDSSCVILGRLECAGTQYNCSYDPHAWNSRTFSIAHQYIASHFDDLQSGAVIDVEFILGETVTPKKSESEE